MAGLVDGTQPEGVIHRRLTTHDDTRADSPTEGAAARYELSAAEPTKVPQDVAPPAPAADQPDPHSHRRASRRQRVPLSWLLRIGGPV